MSAGTSNNPISKDLLRQLELKKAQIELNVRFSRNMELFKDLAPSIYHAYKDYQPEELRLSLHPDGYVELVNFKLNNKPVYPESPIDFAAKQVEVFQRRPLLSKVNLIKSEAYNDRHIHMDVVNNVLDEFADEPEPKSTVNEDPIGLLIMTGCGLGYQIHELINRFDIYGLCLMDPHKDSFYASLHTIDWAPIFDYFNQPGRMIKLCIGMRPEKVMTHLKLLTDAIGLHTLIHTFIYRHFKSKEEEEFLDLYKREFHLNALGLGFFDDEQISLAHTTANTNSGIPLLRQNSKAIKDLPAFIIGNGPSLDSLKEFVSDNHENAALFSCGTSLGSLAKLGIKPDYHVEMERTKTMRAWLLKGTTAEYRKGISILGLNNIHPETFELFDDRYMAAKANDLGERLLKEEISSNDVEELNFCNPTVTNCALSFAYSLGFRTFYLIGVDLGMTNKESHHATTSVHFELDKEKLKANNYTDNNYEIEGNFVDKVLTTPTLDSSRVNFERFIFLHKDITIYNPNNGAKIKGAHPLTNEQLVRLSPPPQEKQTFKNEIKSRFIDTKTREFSPELIHRKYLKPLYNIKKQLKLEDGLSNYADIFQEQHRVYSIIKHLEDLNPPAAILLRGSVNTMLGMISRYCQFADKDQVQSRYAFIQAQYNDLIDRLYKVLKEDAFRQDDTLTYWEKQEQNVAVAE